jgi:fibronectin-binding autotransporter adhesin
MIKVNLLMKTQLSFLFVLIGLALTATPAFSQTIYSYIGVTGGSWSTDTNWSSSNGGTTNPGSGGAAGNTDIANINSVTSTQNINYDTGASGFLGSLNITETDGALNEVTLQRTLTLTNSLNLAASNGTAELATGTSSADFALSVGTGTITIGSGGELALGQGAANITASAVTVNSGGTLATLGATSGQGGQIITGTLTVNSGGTMNISTNSSLVVDGDFTMNGTATNFNNFGSYSSASTGFILSGATNVIAPTNTVSIKNLVLFGAASTSTSAQVSGLTLNAFNGSVQQFTSTYAGPGAQISGNLFIGDETVHSGEDTFQLGSNLTVSGTLGSPTVTQGANGTTGSGNLLLAIDLNSHTLDFTTGGTTTQVFKPTTDTNSKGATTWNIGSSAAGGTGTIEANNFTLSAVSSSQNGLVGAVNITNSITLQATGAAANDLGNGDSGLAAGGTISATSTFLYTGTGAATLTSNRAIGSLTVQSTGTLQLLSSISTGSGDIVTINSGGTLDLNGNAVTGVTTLALGNGTGGGTIGTSTGTPTLTTSSGVSVSGTGNNINTGVTVVGAITQATGSGLTVDGTAGTDTVGGTATTLNGTGTLGALTLNTGGTITPGTGSPSTGTMNASSLTFNNGGTLAFNLSASSSTSALLSLTGAFTKGTAGTFDISLTGGEAGQDYDLVNFGSTTFANTDFTEVGSVSGSFQIVGNDLDFDVAAVPEPSTWALMLGGVALLVVYHRRQRKLSIG